MHKRYRTKILLLCVICRRHNQLLRKWKQDTTGKISLNSLTASVLYRGQKWIAGSQEDNMPRLALTECILLKDTFMTCPLAYFQMFVIKQTKWNTSVLLILFQQQTQIRRKLFEASHSLRSVMFGQDRYKRRYWVLPRCGGVFVEGLESGDGERMRLNQIMMWRQKHLLKEGSVKITGYDRNRV